MQYLVTLRSLEPGAGEGSYSRNPAACLQRSLTWHFSKDAVVPAHLVERHLRQNEGLSSKLLARGS